jgi:leucyl-tRNA synthetase
MEYNFTDIEKKWQSRWAEKGTYKTENNSELPKYYVLDMFPYPSGAGLHVGHPLGYIASDIFARYKKHNGYNVLHPMGFDAFGLPAEQYAIETGQHPAVTTKVNIEGTFDIDECGNVVVKKEYIDENNNIKREAFDSNGNLIPGYKKQLKQLGLSFDWSREVTTSDPSYYKWTQWIFLQLFDSWYNKKANKAEKIDSLIAAFEKNGTAGVVAATDYEDAFTAEQWKAISEKEKQKILGQFRLAYLAYADVNWCPALGTVLANDEVKDGVSERGGHPVFRKKMRQWFLRITAYAERLLNGLNEIDWPEPLKEQQRNWIGRSEGAEVNFHLSPNLSPKERGENRLVSKPEQAYYTTDGQWWNLLIEKAKEMRTNPTIAENILWQALRAKQTGVKIRRQHIIDRFIVDFVCLSKQLVIEVDGDIHDFRKEEDEARTKALNEKGFKVIRFNNEEVIHQTESVINKIVETLNTQTNYPNSEAETCFVKEGKEEYSYSPSSLPGGEGRGGVITVFTTRPDTIFGATFMVLAPEHELIEKITTPEQKEAIEKYLSYVKSRSDVERQQEKKVTGEFTGAYAINPFTGKNIPIWIAEYVLAGYGTGAIMAVPSDDDRDHAFATKFGLEIIDVIDKSKYPGSTRDDKVGIMINSGFLTGMEVPDAIQAAINEIEKKAIGKRQINYRLRDAGFSRQRYWGEPFPIVYKDDTPYPLAENDLPLVLPETESYKPTEDGEAPLARNTNWVVLPNGTKRETDTMPGYAGSSWYWLRYMDPKNDNAFVGKEAEQYWQDVDLYIGGSEHAVGHLMYSRFWQKFLYDRGFVTKQEPFKKLINQGMIQGVSEKAMINIRFSDKTNQVFLFTQPRPHMRYIDKDNVVEVSYVFYSYDIIQKHNLEERTKNVPIQFVNNSILSMKNINELEAFWGVDYKDSVFVCEGGYWHKGNFNRVCDGSQEFRTKPEVEKMSKRWHNVVNPDDVVAKYGADCFRMYEMFLGPIEQHKPWDTKGIEGVSRFLKKLWRLFHSGKEESFLISEEPANKQELKVLHKTIKKITEDTERFSFNTAVSAFMVCVNELSDLKCNKKEILSELTVLISPYAPHISEELWEKLGNKQSISSVAYPKANESYLVENSFTYPVSFNGKTRFTIELPTNLSKEEIEKEVMACSDAQKWLNGNPPKKVIVVPGRIVNVVL